MWAAPSHEHRSDPPAVGLQSGQGRAIIAAAVLGSALAYMSDDMLNIALPSISDDLGVGVPEMQWVVNGYFITMLSLMLTAGSFGDIRGHRRTYLSGLVVFAVGAVVASTAPSIQLLVAGRAIQGGGAALVLACGLALVNASFRDSDRSQAVGVYMGLTGVVTAAGPVLGGLLVDLVSWRAIFVAPLVFPVTAAFVMFTTVPETSTNPQRRIDTRGALFAFFMISTLSYTLIRGPAGWMRPDVLVGMAVAVLSAWAFVRSQRHSTDPILPLVLFRNRTFSGGNAVTLLSYTVSAGVFLFLVVQLQTTLDYRPVRAGVAVIPIYLVMLVGSPVSGRLADRIGARIPIVAGNLILAAGTWWLSLVTASSIYLLDILPATIVLALGLAALAAPLTSATLSSVGKHDQGVAAGVNNTVGQLAGLLMIVVLPAVAGISGTTFDSPDFSGGYQLVMRVCTMLCLAAAGIAAVTIAPDARADTEVGRR